MVRQFVPSGFLREQRGATIIEMTLVIMLLLVLVLGFIDFGFALFQWNQASKAVQIGARLASVSDPVDSTLTSYTGLAGGVDPGDPIIVPHLPRVCNGATNTCTNGTFNQARLTRIVRGGDGNCGTAVGQRPGMCDIFPRIDLANVVIEYVDSGLGYAGRPGGPVPTIQVRIQNIPFEFFFLGDLLGFGQINIPPMTSTITGEDLCSFGASC